MNRKTTGVTASPQSEVIARARGLVDGSRPRSLYEKTKRPMYSLTARHTARLQELQDTTKCVVRPLLSGFRETSAPVVDPSAS